MTSPTAGPSSDVDKAQPALPKGKACLACRKRKVKCDAKSPCTNCIRMTKECVYEEEWERVKRLQGQVHKLERKLEALQGAPYIPYPPADPKGGQEAMIRSRNAYSPLALTTRQRKGVLFWHIGWSIGTFTSL
ncbi:hypothetical protein FRB93_000448 [Tulasnella sp. JGI-2019a]|nr:hypothetical protein FRB93_000448 [Tulasnella sp. JGI-2019a]